MRTQVVLFQAGDGDCILIRCIDATGKLNVLVDGGRAPAVGRLKAFLLGLPPEERRIDLLILTHIDADHIAGAIEIARDDELAVLVGGVWFNDAKHCANAAATSLSTGQGNTFSELIEHRKWPWNCAFKGGPVVRAPNAAANNVDLSESCSLRLLGPTKEALSRLAEAWPVELAAAERGIGRRKGAIPMGGSPPDVVALAASQYSGDPSVTNASSIAFLLRHGGHSVFVGADSSAEDMLSAINNDFGGRLKVDVAIGPHHGSKTNMSRALASLLDARMWAFSTTGARHEHPDPETIARILRFRHGSRPLEIVFNSLHLQTRRWDASALMRDYGFSVRFPDPNCEFVSITLCDPPT
jgi:beta-lactamase superfamily II metal-dependent hydrolase